MVKVLSVEHGNSISIHGKVGVPFGYGRIWFGRSLYGFEIQDYGIYQRRHTKAGQIIVREHFYWPKDTITAPRTARRLVFSNAISAWQALTNSEKQTYNDLQYPKNMSGYNRFISLWLRTH